MTTASSHVTSSAERITGRVKWFNNKAGYGFVTVTDGDRTGTDIFVHHSSVVVSNQQYKYLVQGEYVEFSLISTQGGAHEYQAAEVSGIKGGLLMCETRHEFRITRTKSGNALNDTVDDISQKPSVTPRSASVRGSSSKNESGAEWTLVSKDHPSQTPSQPHSSSSSTADAPTSKPRGRGRPPRAK